MMPEEIESEVRKRMGNILGVDYRKLFFHHNLNKVFQEYFSFSNKHSKDS